MSLSSENGSGMVMPVSPMYGGYGNNSGFGNGWGDGWWILLLLLFAGGWNNGGFGGGFNGGYDGHDKTQMVQKLEQMMRETEDVQERENIRRAIEQLER